MFIKYEPSTVYEKGFGSWTIFWDPDVVKNHDFSQIWKTHLGPQKHSETHTWTSGQTPDLRELRFHMTRRAVVSRVMRVQRRYTVRIRPIRSMGLVNVGWIFELLIDLYRICTHFSYIEYVSRIHLVKISLIFIKYEPSTERSKGLGHERFFLDPYVVKHHDFSWIWKILPGPEKHSKTHTWTSGKTPVLRELRFQVTRRAVASRVIRV